MTNTNQNLFTSKAGKQFQEFQNLFKNSWYVKSKLTPYAAMGCFDSTIRGQEGLLVKGYVNSVKLYSTANKSKNSRGISLHNNDEIILFFARFKNISIEKMHDSSGSTLSRKCWIMMLFYLGIQVSVSVLHVVLFEKLLRHSCSE